MDTSPEKYVERLIEISNRKYKLLQDMLALTGEQANAINESSIEGLEKLVDSKQAKINEIDKIDEEFNVYFQRLKQQLKIKSLDELSEPAIKGARELQGTVKRLVALMNEIFALEKQNNQKAKGLLDSLANEVKKLSQTKKVNLAYNHAGPKILPSYFIDKKK